MLMICFSFEGLKHPSNRSSPKLIELFVRRKTELVADESIGCDVGRFVSADVSASGAQVLYLRGI
jgi:hypothetical protein